MMKIGIDGNPWANEKGGIPRCTELIIKYLLKNDPDNQYVIFFNKLKGYRRRKAEIGKDLQAYPNARMKFNFWPGKLRDWLFRVGFPSPLFFGEKVDVFVGSMFSSIARHGYKKQVVIIHDLSYFVFDNVASPAQIDFWKKATRLAAEKCQKIIVISEATKRDVAKYLGEEAIKKTEVVYLAAEPDKFSYRAEFDSSKIKEKFADKREYFLSVCGLEPRKNLIKLIEAYNLLDKKTQSTYPLLLVGAVRWGVSDLLEEIEKNKNIKITGHVSDEDLVDLYRGAKVFVYPSFYEGFGLPPLEAMRSGIPVIVGRNSSLPEVCGEVGVYVNEMDATDIREKIEEVEGWDDEQRQMNIKKSLIQASKFSWDKTAVEISKIITEVNSSNSWQKRA